MKLVDRKRLMAKSLLAFGRTSRYKTIMDRGRKTPTGTVPISAQEMEDTLDYILAEREKNQAKMLEELENE